MDQELFNPQSSSVSSSRIIYTPSTFVRTSLLHLQEVGSLQAVHPHVSQREDLVSFLCFIVLSGKADFIAQYLESGDLYGMIVSIIKTMPGAPVIMVVVLLTMIAFYATSFDSIALTASCYSYHRLGDNEQPNKGIQLMWCILLILLPIALLFAESSMNNLQSVSIVAAFPIGAVIVMIAISFMKDAKKYMENLEKSAKEKGEN